MLQGSDSEREAVRLEHLWAGEFGDAYIERNREAGVNREHFWAAIMAEFPARRVLEVGCNIGANLSWICQSAAAQHVCGVDVNVKALLELRRNLPGVHAVWSPARMLPFRSNSFDLVFTMGVLIHQPESALASVMSEILRCSGRYALCAEYFSEKTVEIEYRRQKGALFKRSYGAIYRRLYPSLILLRQGFLRREEGWDDATYWLFKKPEAHSALLGGTGP